MRGRWRRVLRGLTQTDGTLKYVHERKGHQELTLIATHTAGSGLVGE